MPCSASCRLKRASQNCVSFIVGSIRGQDGRGWCAMFSPSGFEHSLTSHAGSAWARSPWEAVQRAAADTLMRLGAPESVERDWTLTDESLR
jgi:hypothetical protein